jgi:hypothetical protein
MACANGTWLFRLAQEWYTTHPGEQISHAVWASKVQEAVLQNDPRHLSSQHGGQGHGVSNERFDISAHDWLVTWVSSDMIPVLAAVTLGFSTEELASVVQHHNVGLTQLAQCSVIENFMDERTDLRTEDASRRNLSRWTLIEEVINALCLDPKAVEELVSEVHQYGLNTKIRLACLLQDIPGLWPSTQLDQHIEALHSGIIDKNRTQFQFIENHTFCSLEEIHDFSDEELRRIAERTGILTLGTTRELGFNSFFFFDLFEDLASPKYPDATYDDSGDLLELGEPQVPLIGRFLNSIECPELLSRINAKIRESISEFDASNMRSGINCLHNLETVLNPVKYADVLNDLVLKINLFPMSGRGMPRQSYDGPAFDVFYVEPSLILSKLAGQLLKTESSHFKTPHFLALSRVITFDRAQQDTRSIDMPALVIKLLQAHDAYQDSRCCLTNGYPTEYIKDRAAGHLGSFLQYVGRIATDFDYSRIQAISSKSSLLLATSGFDIKKLPRLNKRDLGDVLSDRMGL